MGRSLRRRSTRRCDENQGLANAMANAVAKPIAMP